MIKDLITQLGIDNTLWIQLGVFVVFYAWIRFVFFPPFLKLMSKREALTSGMASEAEELNRSAEAKEADLALKMARVAGEARAEREKAVLAAKAVANGQLDEARKEAKREIERARSVAEKEVAAEFVKLKPQASELSDLFVTKLTNDGGRT
jgi:F-type H+-transporting ATPase subunit b